MSDLKAVPAPAITVRVDTSEPSRDVALAWLRTLIERAEAAHDAKNKAA